MHRYTHTYTDAHVHTKTENLHILLPCNQSILQSYTTFLKNSGVHAYILLPLINAIKSDLFCLGATSSTAQHLFLVCIHGSLLVDSSHHMAYQGLNPGWPNVRPNTLLLGVLPLQPCFLKKGNTREKKEERKKKRPMVSFKEANSTEQF